MAEPSTHQATDPARRRQRRRAPLRPRTPSPPTPSPSTTSTPPGASASAEPREHNLKSIQCGHPPRPPRRHHRPLRLRQILPRLRHNLRGGPEKIHGEFVGLMRGVLDQLKKPDIDDVEGLPPTIAIEQRSGWRIRGRLGGRRRFMIICGCCTRGAGGRAAERHEVGKEWGGAGAVRAADYGDEHDADCGCGDGGWVWI